MMNMRKLICIIVFVFSVICCSSQDNARNKIAKWIMEEVLSNNEPPEIFDMNKVYSSYGIPINKSIENVNTQYEHEPVHKLIRYEYGRYYVCFYGLDNGNYCFAYIEPNMKKRFSILNYGDYLKDSIKTTDKSVLTYHDAENNEYYVIWCDYRKYSIAVLIDLDKTERIEKIKIETEK
jgi:hypothetical protein